MKKLQLIIIFLILAVFCYGQVPFYKNIEIRKAAPQVWVNGVGGQLKLYNSTITESDGKFIFVGGIIKLNGDTVMVTSDTLFISNRIDQKVSLGDSLTIYVTPTQVVDSILVHTDNSANWNIAYDWGDHAAAGYSPKHDAVLTGTTNLESMAWDGVRIDAVADGGTDIILQRSGTTIGVRQPDDYFAFIDEDISMTIAMAGDTSLSPTPGKVGDRYLNTLTHEEYVSYGDSTRGTWTTDPLRYEKYRAWTRAGSIWKLFPLSGGAMSGASTMTNHRAYYVLYEVKVPTVITGFKYCLLVAGVYNTAGDEYNGIAISEVTGTDYHKIDSTANSVNMWKAAINQEQTIDLPAPRTLQPGWYMVSCIWRSSDGSPATAPQLYTMGGGASWVNRYATNGGNYLVGYVTGDAQTDVPHTMNKAGLTYHAADWAIIMY